MFESETKPIWWLPTLGLFLFLAVELGMFANPDRHFEDPGVGRHLRTAEVILESGQIPRTDPLSYTKSGEPWFDFEWAFETTVGELYRAGGLPLVCAFGYAIFATTILGIYRTLLQSKLPMGTVLLVTGITFCTLYMHFSARPVLFTYLFMTLVVEVWRRHPQPRRQDWLFLPVIFVAWANLHAGWLAALIFLIGSLAGRLLDRISRTVDGDEAPLIPWIGLTLLCLLATAVNPWGWALHKHVVLMATTYKSFALWDEYLPPNFGSPNMAAITVLFIIVVVFLGRVCRGAVKWRWEIVLPILFFLYEGLKAQRHVLLLIVVAAVPLALDLAVLLQLRMPSFVQKRYRLAASLATHMGNVLKENQSLQRRGGGDAWLSLIAALILTGLFLRTPIAHNIHVGKSVTSQLVAFLKDHPDRFQRPLNTTGNAGPLLWAMRPNFRDSIDDRGDFYGDDVVFSFAGLTTGAAGWEEKLNKGNYDSLIIEPYWQLNQLLHLTPGWKEVYRDEHAVVYWKNTAVSP